MQAGSVPFQIPISLHTLISSPAIKDPLEQTYMATEPGVLTSGSITEPLIGELSTGHTITAGEMEKQTIHIIIYMQ